MNADKLPFGERVKRAREALGWSQDELAKKASTTQSTVGRIEKGDSLFSRAAPRIAQILDIPFTLSARQNEPPIHVPIEAHFERPVHHITSGQDEVPVYGAAEGGEGTMILDKNPIDYVPTPEPLRGVSGGYLVYISGDSMWPAYRAGERAIVHPRLPPVPDETCVFYTNDATDDRSAIKHLVKITADTWVVEQYNPLKQFELDRREWPICHRVVGKYTRR